MTADERERVRQAIDRQARERLAECPPERVCMECGGDSASTTIGCDHCWDRRRNRRRWTDPVWREKERLRGARRREARRAAACPS